MYGNDDPTNTGSMPTPGAAGTNGWFQAGNPTINLPATTITVDWLNGVTAELLNVLTAAGVTPAKATTTQLTTAIKQLIKSNPGYQYLYFCTPTAVTAGNTVFIGPSGVCASGDNGAQWVMPFAGNIVGVQVNSSAAPGGTATANAQIYNALGATSASATITSAATSATWTGTVAVAAGAPLCVHVSSSAGAANMYLRGFFIVQPT